MEKEKFAKGICFYKLFWVFLIASIFGAYYEQILNMVIHYYHNHEFVWTLRRGVIYGPISPVYGMGAVLFTYLLCEKPYSNLNILIRGAFIGGILEYLISFLQETFIGTISWDYSNKFLNINGRTTIPYMLFWGLLSLLFAKIVYPFISKYIESMNISFGTKLTNILIVLLLIDFFISWGALIRQMFRIRGYHPFTPLGNFFDKYYPDEILKKYYTNMKVVG